MSRWGGAFVLLSLVFVSGCGKGSGPPPTDPGTGSVETVLPADQLRARLNAIAASGEGGSSLGDLRPSIESYRAIDAKKSAELLTDLDKLEAAEDQVTVKAIASQMAAKL